MKKGTGAKIVVFILLLGVLGALLGLRAYKDRNAGDVPAAAPAAEAPQAAPAVTITQEPESATLSVGGKASFTARAENAVGMSWEFVDPEGKVHDAAEAAAMNLGLSIIFPEGDSVVLSNAPASLNGWSVQARFDGQGGSAVTSRALIYVRDDLAAYQPVLQDYLGFFSGGKQSGELLSDYLENGDAGYYIIKYGSYDVSLLAIYSEGIGYALQDLNGDGVSELLIGSMPTEGDYPEAACLLDLFTLVNGVPQRVTASSERVVYKLRSDGLIFYRGSGGVSFSSIALYRFNGAGLEKLSGLLLDNGNFYLDDAPIGEEEFWQKADEWENPAVAFDRTQLQ